MKEALVDLARRFGEPLLFAAAGACAAVFQLRRKARREPAPAEDNTWQPLASPGRAREAELTERCRASEESVRLLRRSLLSIPEIAQRLYSASNVREITEVALDLVDELFAPSYALFYAAKREGLAVVARRGECEFPLGHRLASGEGVVGWTALRQLPFTSVDALSESRAVRERELAAAMPSAGFSLCLPIVSGDETSGVILIGPTGRALENPKELGRTIALLTAVALANIRVLAREKHLATTDGLTGLLNKRSILDFLRARLAAQPAGPISVFMFDVDHFKKYNDANGHLSGDELLRGMGDLMREHSRDGEGLGRYGGEEFVLVLDGVPKPQALAAAERLRELVENAPFDCREGQPGGRLTISGGVATWPADASSLDSLLRAADEALYAAKRAGRNRVLAYHVPELEPAASDDDFWDLRKTE